MEYVATHPWSLGIACFLVGYWLAIHLHRHAIRRPPPLCPEITDAEIAAAARAGREVEAVKLYRLRSGAGLVKARDAVATIARQTGL